MPTDGLFDQILKFLTSVGLVEGIISIAIITIMVTFYRYTNQKIVMMKEGKDRQINDLNRELVRKEEKHAEKIEHILNTSSMKKDADVSFGLNDLKRHPIFSNIEYWIYVQIPRVHFKEPVKRAVFSDYMIAMNRILADEWQAFLTNTNIEKLSMETLCDEIIRLMTKTTNVFTEYLERNCQMPKEIITALSDSHHLSELFMIAMWNSICRSQVLDTNFDKVYTLLNIRMQINEVLLHEVASKLSELNGKFDGINYTQKL